MDMEPVPYELKSRPGEIIDIPRLYSSEANNLVGHALECTPNFAQAIGDHPYLKAGSGISGSAVTLVVAEAGTPESLKYQDLTFLRVCLYENRQRMRNPERQEAMELDIALTDLVRDLCS